MVRRNLDVRPAQMLATPELAKTVAASATSQKPTKKARCFTAPGLFTEQQELLASSQGLLSGSQASHGDSTW